MFTYIYSLTLQTPLTGVFFYILVFVLCLYCFMIFVFNRTNHSLFGFTWTNHPVSRHMGKRSIRILLFIFVLVNYKLL